MGEVGGVGVGGGGLGRMGEWESEGCATEVDLEHDVADE